MENIKGNCIVETPLIMRNQRKLYHRLNSRHIFEENAVVVYLSFRYTTFLLALPLLLDVCLQPRSHMLPGLSPDFVTVIDDLWIFCISCFARFFYTQLFMGVFGCIIVTFHESAHFVQLSIRNRCAKRTPQDRQKH